VSALLLNRRCSVVDTIDGSVLVVCEPSRRFPTIWCAAIRPDPENRLRMWVRDYLPGHPDDLDGRAVIAFLDLPPGFYEARSTRTARESQSICFAVTARGTIEILDDQGDVGRVIAALNGLTPEQFQEARSRWSDAYPGPPLEGSPGQVAYAVDIRDRLVTRANAAGDLALAARLLTVHDATWFIANKGRQIHELWARLSTPVH
jgi:hypothetical protein